MSQVVTKICDAGAELELSWGVQKEWWLRENVAPALGGYLSKTIPLDENTRVTIRISPGFSEVTARKVGGGYVVAVESDADGEVEDSILSDIRERDREAPYKRADHRYKHYETAYWVGGSSDNPKVSHTTGTYYEYVINAGTPKRWERPAMLLKAFYHEASKVWVYIEKGTPTGGVGVTLLANNAKTGNLVVIGILSVPGDAKMTGEDLSWTDASPDGSKVMFVWREVDSMMGFTTKKVVREHSISKWSDEETLLPVVNMTPKDTDVSDVGTGSLDDADRGTVTSTTKSFFGYGWDGTLRYATEVYTYTHPPESPGSSAIFDELGYYPDGTYSDTWSPITNERQIYIGGSLIASARASGSGSGSVTIESQAAMAGTDIASVSGDDIALKYFDPRTGAFILFRNSISTSSSQVWSRKPVGQSLFFDSVLSKSGSTGPTTVELNMGTTKKVWEVAPKSDVSSSSSTTTSFRPLLGFKQTVNMSLSAYARMRFASRKKDEAVFGMQIANKNLFAVIGPAIADKPMFISEDTSGLKTHGKVGLRVTNIYPV